MMISVEKDESSASTSSGPPNCRAHEYPMVNFDATLSVVTALSLQQHIQGNYLSNTALALQRDLMPYHYRGILGSCMCPSFRASTQAVLPSEHAVADEHICRLHPHGLHQKRPRHQVASRAS